MSLPLEKLVNWQDVRKLYNDLRDRIKDKYTKPKTGIPATDFAAGAVPVTDVQINGSSILNNGVANISKGSSSVLGVFKVDTGFGTGVSSDGAIALATANDSLIKQGTNNYRPIMPGNQHISAFYALAKLAGADMASIQNTTVGTYPEAQKQAIQKMLGLSDLFGPYEDDITADQAYAIGETFVMNGKRYKSTAAISQGGVITPGTNCEPCPVNLSDVQVDGTSIIQNGIASIPMASPTNFGVVKPLGNAGIYIATSNGNLCIDKASSSGVKAGTNVYNPIVPAHQHESAFYGLAKAAGDTTQASSDNPVGTYTDNAKTAILAMLGISLSNANSAQEVIAAYTNSAIRTDASGVSF